MYGNGGIFNFLEDETIYRSYSQVKEHARRDTKIRGILKIKAWHFTQELWTSLRELTVTFVEERGSIVAGDFDDSRVFRLLNERFGFKSRASIEKPLKLRCFSRKVQDVF